LKDRKPQNSALLIATLGVYLGLVLAGAAPQVLANAALSKQFNVRDEIEFKDDLDNKPDKCDEGKLRANLLDYETRYLWFNHESIDEYAGLVERILEAFPEKIDAVDINWKSAGDLRPSRTVTASLAYPFGFLGRGGSEWLDADVLLTGNGLPGKSFTFSVFRNSLGSEFRFESQQIPYDAPLVRALYSSALEYWKCPQFVNDDVILRNTELTVEGDHLVIITRLPRGSLDAMLADRK